MIGKKLIALAVVAMLASTASAAIVTLRDANSLLRFSTAFDTAFTWKVDGDDQLFKETFFYRRECLNREVPFAALRMIGKQQTMDTLRINYIHASLRPKFKVSVLYDLDGSEAGSGESTLKELVTITNLQHSALDFSLFEYTDLDLNQDRLDDVVSITTPGGIVTMASQYDAEGPIFSESIAGFPQPDLVEAGRYDTLLAKLTDGDVDDLNNNLMAGPDDVAWAFQWNMTLRPCASLTVCKVKKLMIPEPITLIGAVMGIASLAGYMRKRR